MSLIFACCRFFFFFLQTNSSGVLPFFLQCFSVQLFSFAKDKRGKYGRLPTLSLWRCSVSCLSKPHPGAPLSLNALLPFLSYNAISICPVAAARGSLLSGGGRDGTVRVHMSVVTLACTCVYHMSVCVCLLEYLFVVRRRRKWMCHVMLWCVACPWCLSVPMSALVRQSVRPSVPCLVLRDALTPR
ncbi:hypothetical protein E2C01_077539 [Portunus trituberculatus]|uniref:Uncharacterized protein n=1 Tax=Portunus trituberculatus TaxID=210409 RepID=A0A5B7IKH4_PORTR|nr:hypothetical protein [Portunus trituberculatus]